ncbi:hypothetical protein HY030_03315 [Candidatus Gottesmanbacteria bacterium]|nr:hypothetical protein [Candidatus Gottesmanbacteria bacterium]
MLKLLQHLFLPHPTNNHKARLLHHSSLLVYIFLFLASQIMFSLVMFTSPQVLGLATNINSQDLEEAVNKERIENGLTPLKINNLLNKAATEKANDMFTKGYWAHFAPDGKTPWFFIDQAGYQYKYAGENLARDFALSNQVVAAWMKSATHKKNILDSKFSDMGLAVVNGNLSGEPTTLVVQLFGTQTQNPPQISAVNSSGTEALAVNINQSVKESIKSVQGAVVSKPTFNIFSLTKQMAMALGVFLIILLYVDAVLVFRKKVYRISGNNIAHMVFFFFLLAALYLTERGAII